MELFRVEIHLMKISILCETFHLQKYHSSPIDRIILGIYFVLKETQDKYLFVRFWLIVSLRIKE